MRLEEQADLLLPAMLVGDTSGLELDAPVEVVFHLVIGGRDALYFQMRASHRVVADVEDS